MRQGQLPTSQYQPWRREETWKFLEVSTTHLTRLPPERLFTSVGLFKSDLWQRGVTFWTPCWLKWWHGGLNKHPKLNFKESKRNDTHTHSQRECVCNLRKETFSMCDKKRDNKGKNFANFTIFYKKDQIMNHCITERALFSGFVCDSCILTLM
jgi:hypothetical protein